MQSSQNLELGMMGAIDRQYGLQIKRYWQTVHKICKHSATFFLLYTGRKALCKCTTYIGKKTFKNGYMLTENKRENTIKNHREHQREYQESTRQNKKENTHFTCGAHPRP